MTVTIEPLVGKTLSGLISLTYGPILDYKESEIFDYCQRMGEVYTGYVDNELVCCWGLMPPSFLSMQAYLWMWCKDDKVQHQFLFVRHSQRQVEKMLERFDTIVGHCLQGSKSIRWLRWLGAEFADYPEEGKLMFTIRRKVNG